MSTDVIVEQQRFADFLKLPELQEFAQYWDLSADGYDRIRFDAIQAAIKTAEPPQRVLLQFLSAIWLGENVFKFNMFDATLVLNDQQMAIVKQWIAKPFWPKF